MNDARTRLSLVLQALERTIGATDLTNGLATLAILTRMADEDPSRVDLAKRLDDLLEALAIATGASTLEEGVRRAAVLYAIATSTPADAGAVHVANPQPLTEVLAS